MADRKITDLTVKTPEFDQYFVVADEEDNFRVSFLDIAEYSSINTKSGTFTDVLSLSGNPVVTGRVEDGMLSDLYIKDIESRINFGKDFAFFSNFECANGHFHIAYYNTPTESLYISGIFANDFSDCSATIRWNGPANTYIGNGYINSDPIPEENIIELAPYTRRFQGFINNMNLSEVSELSCAVDDFINTIPLVTIENGPQASSFLFEDLENITPAPGMQIGTESVKGGDIVDLKISYNFNNYDYEQEKPGSIFIYDEGLAAESVHTDLVWNDDGDGIMHTIIPIEVSDATDRNGELGVYLHTVSNAGFTGVKQNTNDAIFNESMSLDNTMPSLSVQKDTITYPVDQQALKNNQTAVVTYVATNYDTINFYSPNNQIATAVSNTVTNGVDAHYTRDNDQSSNPGYNAEETNLIIGATLISNGNTNIGEVIVNIADKPLELTHNLPAILKSLPGEGHRYEFTLISDQKFSSAPTLSLDPTQDPISILTNVSEGTDKDSNVFAINIIDGDQRGEFNFTCSAFNLVGDETTTVITPYIVQGLQERIVEASPGSFECGILEIGANVSNIDKLYVENINDHGSGENGGIIYTYNDTLTIGEPIPELVDIPHSYSICTDQQTVFPGGNQLFVLDYSARSSNASTEEPLKFIVREDY
jgi:hypothetical protein